MAMVTGMNGKYVACTLEHTCGLDICCSKVISSDDQTGAQLRCGMEPHVRSLEECHTNIIRSWKSNKNRLQAEKLFCEQFHNFSTPSAVSCLLKSTQSARHKHPHVLP